MKALTLHQPWSWAIAHAGKRVVNRTWTPPKSIIGQRVAIHAGLLLDRDGDIAICQMTNRSLPGIYVHGAVESVATIAGWLEPIECGLRMEVSDFASRDVIRSPWWIGPVGWVLTDVIALPEPVPCRGAQGLWTLWTLSEDVERAVLAQLEATHA